MGVNKVKTNYQGIFFDKQEIQEAVQKYRGKTGIGMEIPKEIEYPHVTLQYKPAVADVEKFKQLIGTEVQVTLSQYGSDGKNEGFYVSGIQTDSPEVRELFDNIPSGVPHITTAIEGALDPETGKSVGKAVDTYKLFDGSQAGVSEIIEPITVMGKLGAFQIVPHIGPQVVVTPFKQRETPFQDLEQSQVQNDIQFS